MDKQFLKIINFLLDQEIFNKVLFSIETIDNPGWYIKLDLSETKYKDNYFKTVSIDQDEDNWLECECKNSVIKGVGDVFKLSDIIDFISNSVGSLCKEERDYNFNKNNDEIFKWLDKWYFTWYQDKYNWINDYYRIFILKEKNTDFWRFEIDLEDTKLFGEKFNYSLKERLSHSSFINCYSDGYLFYGESDKFSLIKMLTIFRKWAEENGCG